MCFPDFCFSNRKAYDLYSPENLSGDHRKHRGKCENRGFSPALQMGQFHLKISPKNEKTDRRSGRRRIEKMVDHFGAFQNSSLHLKMTNFSNPSGGSIDLDNFSGRSLKIIQSFPVLVRSPRIQIKICAILRTLSFDVLYLAAW